MKTKAQILVSIAMIFFLAVSTISVNAKGASPFVGMWQAVDVDGSSIRLVIAGPPTGPFNITWTESYISFCSGGPGLVIGTGWLDPDDSYLLKADLRVQCFPSREWLSFSVTWVYDQITDTIAFPEPDPVLMTWYRMGSPIPVGEFQIIAHPDEMWVEGMGFAEGTSVSLRIYDGQNNLLFNEIAISGYREDDPDTVRTEFSFEFELQPGDHLWMTDGRTAKDLYVSTLTCSGVDQIEKVVSGTAEPGSEVIIEYYEDVYFTVTAGADGIWMTSIEGMPVGTWGLASQADEDDDLTRFAFYLPNPRFAVQVKDNWIGIDEFPPESELLVTIYATEGGGQIWLSEGVVADESGNFLIEPSVIDMDLVTGNYITVTGGGITKTHTVVNLDVTDVDELNNVVYGTADPGATVIVFVPGEGYVITTLDENSSDWGVDFDDVGVDLMPGMEGRADIYDVDGDATIVDWVVPEPPE